MPLIDMPLAQLLEYQGRNPCPPDMEAYWDRALAEMQALDPQVELVPHPLQASFAECFHLYFTGVEAPAHRELPAPKACPRAAPGRAPLPWLLRQ